MKDVLYKRIIELYSIIIKKEVVLMVFVLFNIITFVFTKQEIDQTNYPINIFSVKIVLALSYIFLALLACSKKKFASRLIAYIIIVHGFFVLLVGIASLLTSQYYFVVMGMVLGGYFIYGSVKMLSHK